MNVFRIAADSSHLLAIFILLLKIWKRRSCAGFSGRSQILFLIAYTSRYLDLFSNLVSVYNSVMKVVIIGATLATVYLMYVKFAATYDSNHDTFGTEFLIVPAVVLALFVNYDFSPLEVLWTFSIYLESVAIVPQLFLVWKSGDAEIITSHFFYFFFLGSYRGLYILNWVWRYYSEGFYDLIAIAGGVLQTLLYSGFFYLYITKAKGHSIADIKILSEYPVPSSQNIPDNASMKTNNIYEFTSPLGIKLLAPGVGSCTKFWDSFEEQACKDEVPIKTGSIGGESIIPYNPIPRVYPQIHNIGVFRD